MQSSPQCQEESTAWLHWEAPSSLPRRLYLHYSAFQVALRLSEKQIKELLLTMHSMTLISKQIHESSKPTKQPPNPVLLLDTTRHHASVAAAVSISLVKPCFHTVSDTALLVSLIRPFYPAQVEALPPRFQVLCRSCRVF